MNDPNKAINVNLSSLLSLKAELIRKQDEINKTKINFQKRRNTTRLSKVESKSDDKPLKEKRDSEDIIKEEEALEKSRSILQAKAKLYNELVRTKGKNINNSESLVLFNLKDQHDSHSVKKDFNTATKKDSHCTDDETLVEYTDCLGRTRTCFSSDFENVMKRDAELAASVSERLEQSKVNNEKEPGELNTKDELDKEEEHICEREEVRLHWQNKEQENSEKTNVHYQDVFFDEARQHGVGYYAFSTDDEERQQQQRAMEIARDQTIEEQERRDALRAQREAIVAQRVLAAKNRQRLRLGQPPIQTEDLQVKTEKFDIVCDTGEELEIKRKKMITKEEEELREQERKQHIRPWDKNKVEVLSKHAGFSEESSSKETEWTYKPEKSIYSQTEWNAIQRSQRKNEFAPPKDSSISRRNGFDSNTSNFNRRLPTDIQNIDAGLKFLRNKCAKNT